MANITFRYDRAPTGELSGESLVSQTEQALSEISGESSHAEEDAARAVQIATAAESKADQAVATAGQAQSTANSALTTAQSAQSTASQATQTAQSAVTTAQGASQTAQNAVSTAQSAVTAAQNAVTAAQTASNSAADSATAAQGSASAASAAQTAAESAQSAAGQAATVAQGAQTTATSAADSAAAAQNAAELLANPNRYSAKTTTLTLTAGQTVDISDLSDSNVAVGNAVIDAVGNIFSIASIDTTNAQVTLSNSVWSNPAALADLSNVPASKGFSFESYVNGVSWYRLYSDGWLVQGGNVPTDATDNSITLLKNFSILVGWMTSTSFKTASTALYLPVYGGAGTGYINFYWRGGGIANVGRWIAYGYAATE